MEWGDHQGPFKEYTHINQRKYTHIIHRKVSPKYIPISQNGPFDDKYLCK